MQEQELASLRREVAALKDSHTESLMAAPAHSEVTKTAPGPPLQGPEGVQQGKGVTQDTGGQSKSRDRKTPGEIEEEKCTSSPANSRGKASPDSQSRMGTSRDQESAGGTARVGKSLPHMPAAQRSCSGGAHASGKRQRALQRPLLSPGTLLQPAADTPDELEVRSGGPFRYPFLTWHMW